MGPSEKIRLFGEKAFRSTSNTGKYKKNLQPRETFRHTLGHRALIAGSFGHAPVALVRGLHLNGVVRAQCRKPKGYLSGHFHEFRLEFLEQCLHGDVRSDRLEP